MQVGKNVNLHGVSKQPNQNVILACLICLYVFLSIIELLYVIVYVYVSDLVLIACDSLVHDWKHNLQPMIQQPFSHGVSKQSDQNMILACLLCLCS